MAIKRGAAQHTNLSILMIEPEQVGSRVARVRDAFTFEDFAGEHRGQSVLHTEQCR